MNPGQKTGSPGFLRKLFAAMTVTFLLAAGFLFSVVIFSVIALVGAGAWVYFFWKTRSLRKFTNEYQPSTRVFDGESIVVDDAEYVRIKEFTGSHTKQ
jgi:hypothetical protein